MMSDDNQQPNESTSGDEYLQPDEPPSKPASKPRGRPTKKRRGRKRNDGWQASTFDDLRYATDSPTHKKVEQLARLNAANKLRREEAAAAKRGGPAAGAAKAHVPTPARARAPPSYSPNSEDRASAELASMSRKSARTAASKVADAIAGASLSAAQMSAGLMGAAKKDPTLAVAMQMAVDQSVEGRSFAAVAPLIGASQKNQRDVDKSAARVIETAVMSQDVSDRALAAAMARHCPKQAAACISDRDLRGRYAKARVRRATAISRWGHCPCKLRCDAMLANEEVREIFVKKWEASATNAADRSMEGKTEPHRRKDCGKMVDGAHVPAAEGANDDIETHDIPLSHKSSFDIAVSFTEEELQKLSDLTGRAVRKVSQQLAAKFRPWYVQPLHVRHRLTCVCLPHTQGRNLYTRLRNELVRIHENCQCQCDVCRPAGSLECRACDRVPHDCAAYIDSGICEKEDRDFGSGVTASLASVGCYTRDCDQCPERFQLCDCEQQRSATQLRLRLFQVVQELKKTRGKKNAELQNAWRIAPHVFSNVVELKDSLDSLVDDPQSSLNIGSESLKYHRFKNHFLCASEQAAIQNLTQSDVWIEIDYAMALPMYSLEDLRQEFMNGQKEQFAFVSDVRAQDSAMTEAVTRKMIQISKARGLGIENVIFKSDNCAVQCKSATNFNQLFEWTHSEVKLFDGSTATVSTMTRLYGVAMHGKCACDALGALIGNKVTKARLAGGDVDTAAAIDMLVRGVFLQFSQILGA